MKLPEWSDGNRIELVDLTAGSGTFATANVGTGTAADDLGLTTTASGDTITGRRLVSGLRDTLISSLKGGAGLGVLGQLDITNRSGVSSNGASCLLGARRRMIAFIALSKRV